MRLVIAGLILFSMLGAAAVASVAQDPAKTIAPGEKFGGAWAGSFEGHNTGKLELSIVPDVGTGHTGKVSVMPDEGENFTTELKSLKLEGEKMVAKFDAPDGGGEVTLEGTSDGTEAKGTWTFDRQNDQTAKGTWKLTRKAQ